MALTQVSTNGVKDGSLKNADVASDAAIALSKLATGALPSGLTVASANITDGTIVNADIASNAAIALSKLGTSGTAGSGNFLRGDGAWTAIDLTALNASNLTSGTVPDARFPATLPAASGVNLTALNASNLASGTVGTARLGSGTANSSVYLRGDGSWQAVPAGGIGSESSSKRYVIAGPQAGEDIGGDGEDNVFIGFQAGKEQNGNYGVENVLIGSYAGQAQTTAQGSVAIGYKALFSNQTNGLNVAIGHKAQYTSTTSYNCVSVGKEAHYNLTSGDGNTAIGHQAMYNLTSGMDNVAVGFSAGQLWGTDSSDNVAIGYNAFGQPGYTGVITNSVAVGYEALYECRTGIENTAIGSRALYNVIAGKWNTALGYHAGDKIENADKNVCIGYEAGDNLTTAENNICIGYRADPENATDDNRVVIGNSDITSFEVPGCNFKVVTSTASNDYILKIGSGNAARWEQDLGAVAHGWGNHSSAGYAAYSHTHTTYLTSNTADAANGAITFAAGAGAVTISSSNGSDIRFENSGGGSTATGMASLRLKDNFFLIQSGTSGTRFVTENGTARWQMNSSGNISPLADATYDIGTANARIGTIYAQNLSGPSTGKVLQYKHAIKTDTFTTTSTNWVDVPGLITSAISGTASTTLMVVTVSFGKLHNHEGSIGCRLIRRTYDSTNGWQDTVIGVGDSAGNRQQITFNAYGRMIYNSNHAGSYSFTFTDDHNISNLYVQYKVQIQGESSAGSGTMVNRSYDDSNETHVFRGRSISHICVMEVAT